MKKTVGKTQVMLVNIMIGCFICLLITIIGALIVAILLSNGNINESQMGYAVMFITGIAAFVGSLVVVRKEGNCNPILALASGASYYMILLIIGGLVFSGLGDGLGATCVLILGSSGCAALLSFKTKKTKYVQKRKYTNR